MLLLNMEPKRNQDSGNTTPSAATDRFSTQTQNPEDVLKSQTVGLVHLDEFRKRRAEALEAGISSGRTTPVSDR